MSILTPIPRDMPWFARVLFSIPLLGWIARDVAFGHPENFWYALIGAAALWIIAIMHVGVVALYLPMVCLTPVCLIMLIVISRS